MTQINLYIHDRHLIININGVDVKVPLTNPLEFNGEKITIDRLADAIWVVDGYLAGEFKVFDKEGGER